MATRKTAGTAPKQTASKHTASKASKAYTLTQTTQISAQKLLDSAPPDELCGNANFSCAISGTCMFNEQLNTSYCQCADGFWGQSCAERYYFEKVFQVRDGDKYIRYANHTEDTSIEGLLVDHVTLNNCMLRCDQEKSFVCMAINFRLHSAASGECAMVSGRLTLEAMDVAAQESYVSYTRGPEQCYDGTGDAYRGTANVSAKGNTCQVWDEQSPNMHSRTIDNYPLFGLEDPAINVTNNFCRNPDGHTNPWCYTIEGDRWEDCAVPVCTSPTPTPPPPPIVAAPECPADCHLHGSCDHDEDGQTTGGCTCFPGYNPGPANDCSEPRPCLNECSGHGECELGECICEPDWRGGPGDCSDGSEPCPSQCSGHGSCDGHTGRCQCYAGFNGDACQHEAFGCPRNCSGNGACVHTALEHVPPNRTNQSADMSGQVAGYDGLVIMSAAEKQMIAAEPSCTTADDVCTCCDKAFETWCGMDPSAALAVETAVAAAAASMGQTGGNASGACNSTFGPQVGTFMADKLPSCVCRRAGSGRCSKACADFARMCTDKKPGCTHSGAFGEVLAATVATSNHTYQQRLTQISQRATAQCVCSQGFGAADCSEMVCPDMCSGQGSCELATRLCTCNEGFEGANCNTTTQPPCPNDCSGRGTCAGGRCFCQHSWIGEDCSKWKPPACPQDCNGHGDCEDGVCECDKHYSGTACEVFTQPHYAQWPLMATVVPLIILVGFVWWVVFVLHKIDVFDGKSDMAENPILRICLAKRKEASKIVQGDVANSRVKKHFSTYA